LRRRKSTKQQALKKRRLSAGNFHHFLRPPLAAIADTRTNARINCRPISWGVLTIPAKTQEKIFRMEVVTCYVQDAVPEFNRKIVMAPPIPEYHEPLAEQRIREDYSIAPTP
jgi:hypothetical protein